MTEQPARQIAVVSRVCRYCGGPPRNRYGGPLCVRCWEARYASPVEPPLTPEQVARREKNRHKREARRLRAKRSNIVYLEQERRRNRLRMRKIRKKEPRKWRA